MTSLLVTDAERRTVTDPNDPAVGVVAAVEAGGCAVISGPAGVGKSYSLRRAADLLRARGVRVRGIRATASSAAVPFGALLPLLHRAEPALRPPQTEIALALLDLFERSDAVILVDDAHLLDAASGGVLHQSGAVGARIVLTIRDGAPAPDAVGRFVPDLDAAAITVPRLEERQTAGLLEQLLGDPADDGLVRMVHRRSEGLPLAVQALARAGRDSGALTCSRGEWRLDHPVPATGELASLMRSTTASLDEASRRAAELVSLAEGLDEEQLAALRAVEGAERAERAGVLAVGRTGVVSLAHPLLLDALLAGLPELRRRRHLAELVSVIDDGGDAVSRLRRTEWRLELGHAVDPEELLGLVDLVVADDPDRAERYARAAVEVGGGVPARLRLVEVLAHLHRAEEAGEVLAGIDASTLDPETAAAVGRTSAFLLVFALGRPDEALAILDALPPHPMASALRSSAHYIGGRLAVAGREARAVAGEEAHPREARAHAALTEASVLVMSGDHRGFVDWLPVARDLVDDAAAEIPEGREALRLLEGLAAVRVLLDPAATERTAAAGHREALARGSDGERAQWSHQLGEAALLRGDPVTAVGLLRRASRARGRWATTTVGWLRGTLVRALALAGDLADAERELAELRTIRVVPILHGEVALAEAELAACALDLRRAGRLAEHAAVEAPGGGADAWYAAVRFGRSGAASQFVAAAERYVGPGRAAQRQHARGILSRDPAAVEAASVALERAGLGWFAVDAMVQAVELHARRDACDAAPAERLRALAARHPRLRSPLLAASERPALTEREAQVARLVAEGCTARAIAQRLGIGVRTVETHVAHAYRKLDVGSREQLRAVLAR